MDKKLTSGQTYYYVTDQGKIEEDRWSGESSDQNRLQFNNVFTKREEAQTHMKTIQKATSRQMASA